MAGGDLIQIFKVLSWWGAQDGKEGRNARSNKRWAQLKVFSRTIRMWYLFLERTPAPMSLWHFWVQLWFRWISTTGDNIVSADSPLLPYEQQLVKKYQGLTPEEEKNSLADWPWMWYHQKSLVVMVRHHHIHSVVVMRQEDAEDSHTLRSQQTQWYHHSRRGESEKEKFARKSPIIQEWPRAPNHLPQLFILNPTTLDLSF